MPIKFILEKLVWAVTGKEVEIIPMVTAPDFNRLIAEAVIEYTKKYPAGDPIEKLFNPETFEPHIKPH